MFCQLDGAVAPRRVHHERERLSRSRFAHVLEPDDPSVEVELARRLQPTHIRSGHTERGQPFRDHSPAVGLLHSPAE